MAPTVACCNSEASQLPLLVFPAAPATTATSRPLSGSPQDPPAHSSVSPAPATAVDAAGRAAAELAQFQDRQLGDGDDVDPDGPAAMKDSPSVSGDDDDDAGESWQEVVSRAVNVRSQVDAQLHSSTREQGWVKLLHLQQS